MSLKRSGSVAKIIEILGATNCGIYAVVEVLLDNGNEATCYVGGEVEAYYDAKHGTYKAFVKKKKEHTKDS